MMLNENGNWMGRIYISRSNERKYLRSVLNTSGCEKAKKMFRAQQWIYGRLGNVARFRVNQYE